MKEYNYDLTLLCSKLDKTKILKKSLKIFSKNIYIFYLSSNLLDY